MWVEIWAGGYAGILTGVLTVVSVLMARRYRAAGTAGLRTVLLGIWLPLAGGYAASAAAWYVRARMEWDERLTAAVTVFAALCLIGAFCNALLFAYHGMDATASSAHAEAA